MFGCSTNNNNLIFDKGNLDLTKWNFSEHPKITLDGDVLFYWKQWPLDEDNNFDERYLITADSIPFSKSMWTNIGKDAQGYGTYRFFIKRKNSDRPMLIEFLKCTSAAEVWINGELIKKHGKISKIAKEEVTVGLPLRFELPQEEELDIMIVMSSYKHRMGGGFPLVNSIKNKNYFEKNYKRKPLIEGVITFLIMLFGVYQILNWVSSTKDYYFLYLGLFCLLGASRQLFIGECLIYNFFYEINFSIVQKMRYIGYYGGLIAVLLYHHTLFPKHSVLKILIPILAILTLGVLFVLFAPIYYGTFSAPIFQIVGFVSVLYGFYQIIRAIADKTPFAKGMFINLFIVFIILSNDLLSAMLIIRTDFFMNYGVLMYVIFQIIINKKIQRQKEEELVRLSSNIEELTDAMHKKQEEISELHTKSFQQLKSKEKLVEHLQKVASNDESISVKNIIAELKSELLEDSQLTLIKNDIETLNQEFFQRIKELHPSLTKTDLEICSYLRISLSRREIARLRFTSVDAVKKSRNRLRKKMNLSPKIDLEDYIKSI